MRFGLIGVRSGPYLSHLALMISIWSQWVQSGPYGIGFADLGFPEAHAGVSIQGRWSIDQDAVGFKRDVIGVS